MRAMFAIPITALALLPFSVRPAAATAITYDFSGTLGHGPSGDPGNASVTGQFTIDFDTQSITGFDFQTPSGDVNPSTWFSQLFTYTPAVNPADDFVHLAFFNGDGTLVLLFRTTLDAFDGSTFYTAVIDTPGGGVGAGFECNYKPSCTPTGLGSPFVSGGATVHTDTPPPNDPPPPTVPEPASLVLLGSGLVAMAGRLRARASA